ncbi:MAG: hypothetical protein KatS3mg087_1324 [Patescibacteria group bacterium]|nr:MAG: hypothetical protein KatS3mg087_1324 [Patescibacteria group bacterium]
MSVVKSDKTKNILEAIDIAEMLKEMGLSFNIYGQSALLLCPFHSDKNHPSLVFSLQTKYYDCKSCGKRGDAIDFYSRVLLVDRFQAATFLANKFAVPLNLVVSLQKIEEWKQNLQNSSRFLALLSRKGISKETALKYEIGLLKDRITIPLYSDTGTAVSVLLYNPIKRTKFKNLTPYEPSKYLYPADIYKDVLTCDPILITEGPLKALLLRQLGFTAASSPYGARNWREEWSAVFKGKVVYILYDIDRAGQQGAIALAKSIYNYAAKIHIVSIPLDIRIYPKGDITDWVVSEGATREDILTLLNSSPEWAPPSTVPQLESHTPIRVPIKKAISGEFYSKRVETEGLLLAKDTAPYLVPSKISVVCTRDEKVCIFCPVFKLPTNPKGESFVSLDKEQSYILDFIRAPSRQLVSIMKSACGIPAQCRSCVLNTVESWTVEECRFVANIATQKDVIETDDQNFSYLQSFIVADSTTDLQTNTVYKLEGRVYPFPKTQQATLLTYFVEQSQDNIEQFELESPEELKIFQPAQNQTLESKLNEIYSDLEYNVTKIFNRRDLHLVIDLIWHTPLYLKFDNEIIKGWGEAAIIGDSGQGKSHTANKFLEYYGLGERITGKNCSHAGLVGGLIDVGNRWFLQWGIMVIADKRILVIDEAKGASEETIAKLTDIRSSGIAEVVKIEKRKAFARTRLIWISNPRSGRSVSTYSYGIEAIRELFGSLEDVRRLDIALIVSADDVSGKDINTLLSERTPVPNRYTAELCRNLLLWGWSRKEDDIYFTPEAITQILKRATELSDKYSNHIPLIEAADQRYKLARLAAALAIRLFSCDDTYQKVIIKPEHVEYVYQFINQIYDHDAMGYGKFSKDRNRLEIVVDEDVVRQCILNLPYPKDFLTLLSASSAFSFQEFKLWTGITAEESMGMLSLLVRKNAIKPIKSIFVKTPGFVKLCRDMLDSTNFERDIE